MDSAGLLSVPLASADFGKVKRNRWNDASSDPIKINLRTPAAVWPWSTPASSGHLGWTGAKCERNPVGMVFPLIIASNRVSGQVVFLRSSIQP